jgi:hypothetical protein
MIWVSCCVRDRCQRTDGLNTVKPPGNRVVIGGNMEVRLKQEWMGHHAGAIVKVSEICANILFQRDAADKMEPESIEKIRKRLQEMVAKNLLKSSPNK